MNFENKPINFEPRPLRNNPEKVKELLNKKFNLVDRYRPNEEDFSDIYSEEEIIKDLKEIKELEILFEKETEEEKYIRNISDVYEGVIADQIEANAWFGENCETVAASRYDDIKRGIDVVNVFRQDGDVEYLGLGVDVTFASRKEVLEKKLESIKQRIRSGSLPSLKYFQDPQTEEHKEISLPKVIVGSRLSSAEKLVLLWGGKDPEKNKKLKEYPTQSKLILETLFQLKYFYDFADGISVSEKEKSLSNKYREISLGYARMYNIFHSIYESKRDLIDRHYNEISDDIVFETILDFTENNK